MKKAVAVVLAIVLVLGVAVGVWWLAGDDPATQVRVLGKTAGTTRVESSGPTLAPTPAAVPSSEPTVPVADTPGLAIPVGHAVQIVSVPDGSPPPDEDDNFAFGVAVDHGGRLWAARMNGRLGCYDLFAKRGHEFAPPEPGRQDPVTAVAVDRRGRVWAGHAFNGVSVYDGHAWQSYGLLDGPLGEHVTRIATNPTNGDVWVATNRGLTRYSESSGWSYFTRQNGLLSDDFVSIALSANGDVYAATADSGVAVGRAADEYATWTAVRPLGDNRAKNSGPGLSSDWCTDVIVARDGSVYVSTVAGLSYSRDAGKTWAFVRGNPWANRARNATRPPKLPDPTPPGFFNYDAISCVGEDANGNVLVGHPFDRAERLDPKTLRSIETLPEHTGQATQFILHGPAVYVATNRFGVVTDRGLAVTDARASSSPDAAGGTFAFEQSAVDVGLPAPAAPPDAAALNRLSAALATRPNVVAGTLGTDWVTGGDCTGRYGWDYTAFMPMRAYPPPPGITFDVDLGPHQKREYSSYSFFASGRPSADPRCLYFMRQGCRRMGEWNDGTWNPFPDTWEGPDLWMHFGTVAAANRVSVYLINEDGGHNADITRDHPIELKADTGDVNTTDTGPTLAAARARLHMRGVYASFVVGPGKWVLKVNRNYANSTKANGLFVDELTPRADPLPTPGPNAVAEPWRKDLAGVDFRPKWDGVLKDTNPQTAAAAALWTALDKDRVRFATVDWPDRILAYRAVHAASSDEALKAAWRWQLPLWTDADRATWRDGVQEAARRRNLVRFETGPATTRPSL